MLKELRMNAGDVSALGSTAKLRRGGRRVERPSELAAAASRLLDLYQPFASETPTGRRCRQPAARGLAIAHIHVTADLAHGVDDFIRRDRELHSGERHL